MADKSKPKASLEDIASNAERFHYLSEVGKETDHAQKVGGYSSYLEATKKGSVMDYRNRPFELSQHINISTDSEKKDLVMRVESAAYEAVKKIGQGAVTGLALRVGLKDKDYQFYSQAVEKQDAEAVRTKYIELYGKRKNPLTGKEETDEAFVRIALTASPEILIDFAKSQVGKKQDEFVRKNLSSEKTTKGKDGKTQKEIVYDPEKAQKYLVNAIKSEKDQNAQAEYYISIGTMVHQRLAQEKAEKEAKKKAEEAKKK